MYISYKLILITVYGILTTFFLVVSDATLNKTMAADEDVFIIGSGKASGVYFPVAGAICHLLNRERTNTEPLCVVSPNTNTKTRLHALREKRIDFAIIQSDWQYWSYKGAKFLENSEPFISLAAVTNLYTEPLVIAVRQTSSITKLSELKGRKISLGARETAGRSMMEALIGAYRVLIPGFNEVQELSVTQQTSLLCENDIESAVYAVGSPSATLSMLTSKCLVSFLPVIGSIVDQLVKDNTYYKKAYIPGGIYRGIDKDVPTFGVSATLVTRLDVSDKIVLNIIKKINENVDFFRSLHPALNWFNAKHMLDDGLSAPLHPAVQSYYVNK
ncbi:MAG: TAXI family TRAP transporter solute-binding subunit [Alphaproteobacteria bacterium]|nr:TAXI family TRAP transporter solute-binding subunit [Alphaproteobacteria bacterium]